MICTLLIYPCDINLCDVSFSWLFNDRHGTDNEGCTKALLNLPHTMRQLYMHSYCSLVWNKMVTLRMRLYGHQRLVEGDLVLPAGTDKASTRDKVKRNVSRITF